MKNLTLYQRLGLVFGAVLTTFGVLLCLLGYAAAKEHQQRTIQTLNQGLAKHISGYLQLVDGQGLRPGDLEALFHSVMMVNPNIEAYLLDREGRVISHAPPELQLQRTQVNLAPLQAFASNAEFPLLGDNPRHADALGIFSATPILSDGVVQGYLYIVLLGDGYRSLLAQAWQGDALRGLLLIAVAALALALVLGLALFSRITRPLYLLAEEMEQFQSDPHESTGDDGAQVELPVALRSHSGDEIDHLRFVFTRLRQRLNRQMEELQQQDHLRRELVANISHDLRTPMTSMVGYLETLQSMNAGSNAEQRRYLDIAIRQAHRIGRLAEQLFELARLEYEEAPLQAENFSIAELMHDIAQKYALTAQQANREIVVDCAVQAPLVCADIGLIERAISNLLDNAIRHAQGGGRVVLAAYAVAGGVEVRVVDSGNGIDPQLMPGLFERGSPIRLLAARRGGGLGLLITNRILTLHGASINAHSVVGQGTTFSFVLPVTQAA